MHDRPPEWLTLGGAFATIASVLGLPLIILGVIVLDRRARGLKTHRSVYAIMLLCCLLLLCPWLLLSGWYIR